MKKFICLFAVALLTLTSVSTLSAEEQAAPATDSHRAAAKNVFDQMDIKEVFMSGFMTGVEPTLNQMKAAGMPANKLGQVRTAFVQFGTTVANDPELVDRLVTIYTELFNEKELGDIANFYKTETGKKFLSVTPVLTQKSAEVGQLVAGKYQAQLQASIQAILQPQAAQPAPAQEQSPVAQ